MMAGRGPLDLTGTRPALASFFARDERIRVAYLYGSQAQGRATAQSDVDIAVRAAGKGSADDRDDLRDELEAALRDTLGRPDVDVLVLNGADIHLRYQVLTRGQVLYEREAGADIREWNRTLKEYLDTQPLWQRYDQVVRERIREQDPHGQYRRDPALAEKIGHLSRRAA